MSKLDIKHFYFTRWARFSIFGVFFILALLFSSSKAFGEENSKAKLIFFRDDAALISSNYTKSENRICDSEHNLEVVGKLPVSRRFRFFHLIRSKNCPEAIKNTSGLGYFWKLNPTELELDYNGANVIFKENSTGTLTLTETNY